MLIDEKLVGNDGIERDHTPSDGIKEITCQIKGTMDIDKIS
jgi:hypothetical protein